MFALRGIAVSFSIFLLLYAASSVGVCCMWRRVWLYGRRHSARGCADLLFALRIAPLVIATGATLAFCVPSFLLLEPRAVDEPLGGAAVLLGSCGFAVVLAGVWNAVSAWLTAARTVARWSSQVDLADSGVTSSDNPISMLRISAFAPPLTTAGILRPSLWLSRAARFVLTERELETALRHEMVHVRRRDNLRKLVLHLVKFPGMGELEYAWREATEMCADDSAVSSASEALDLAAAVIKLSRLAPLQPPAALTTALVHSPAESVNARVERLIAWTERRQGPAKSYSFGYSLCAALAVAVTLAITYNELLVRVHTATEWLVR